MKRYNLFVFLMWMSFSILSAQQIEYENWDGVFIEIRPDNTNSNRYTEDNEIYQIDNAYYFNYQYITKDGEELYYQHLYEPYITTEDGKKVEKLFISPEWEFVSKEKSSDETITAFRMKVLPDMCNGTQSCIEFRYITNNGEIVPMWEKTGLIENEKNIWQHPPRRFLFKISELNPFPFIQKPYEKGNTWNWSLEIGDDWGDYRWKEWDGIIENQYVYEIIDTNSMIHTSMGDLICYKINSYAESELGKTYLTAYFNEIYGFVRLEYINIDGSMLNIELDKTETK